MVEQDRVEVLPPLPPEPLAEVRIDVGTAAKRRAGFEHTFTVAPGDLEHRHQPRRLRPPDARHGTQLADACGAQASQVAKRPHEDAPLIDGAGLAPTGAQHDRQQLRVRQRPGPVGEQLLARTVRPRPLPHGHAHAATSYRILGILSSNFTRPTAKHPVEKVGAHASTRSA